MNTRPDWLQRALAFRDGETAHDLSLLVARIVLAWIFIYHGAGTLFGAFNGPGLHRMALFFATTAHLHPGTAFALLNGITEFFGGIAVGLGVFARLAAFGLFCDMVIAMATVTFANGIVSNAVGSGYELNLALIGVTAVVAVQGAGRLAVGPAFRSALAADARPPAPSAASSRSPIGS